MVTSIGLLILTQILNMPRCSSSFSLLGYMRRTQTCITALFLKEILKQIAGLPTWNQLDMKIHFYCVWPNWGMFQRNKVGKIVLLQCNSPNIYLDFIVFLSFFDLHKLLNGSLSESELFLWQWRKKVDKS